MQRNYITSISDFKTIIEAKAVYVDKTHYLKAILDCATDSQDQGDDVMLFLRPRRFGKTLTLSMIEHFCKLDYDNPLRQDHAKVLFENLEIYKDKDFCQRHMAQYPVISLSLKDFTADNFAGALLELGNIIGFLYNEYEPIFNRAALSTYEKSFIHSVLNYFVAKGVINMQDSNIVTNIVDTLGLSLKFLSSLLYKIYGRKCIVLIDEYDVPLHLSASYGYYEGMVKVIRSMFSELLKSHEQYVHKVIIAGCMPLLQESIFTGPDKPGIYSVNHKAFNAFIGFSKSEAEDLIAKSSLYSHTRQILDYYGSYNFAGTQMLCPFSVLNFLKYNMSCPSHIEFKNYWANTSGNEIIDSFFSLNDPDASSRLQNLINGQSITIHAKETVSCNEIFKSKSFDKLMILIMHTGYVTALSIDNDSFCIKIPNQEVFSCFKEKIDNAFNKNNSKWFDEGLALKQALFAKNKDQAQSIIKNMLTNFISVRDYGVEGNYHIFLLTVLSMFSNDDFIVQSNRESGCGYYDLSVKDRDLNTCIIIEIKRLEANAQDKDINQTGLRALEQIKSKEYITQALADGYNILTYAIVFYAKSCRIFCN